MLKSLRAMLLAGTALAPAAAFANPDGATVTAGTATVSGEGMAAVEVLQTTPKAILEWNAFDIGAGETTTFVQPDAGSVTLNRVTGGLGPSEILGSLTANGRLYLINPDGMLFGPDSIVDTGGFVATTIDIADEAFLSGDLTFDRPGRADASILNQGRITASEGGFAALVAPGVRNAGVITARLGDVGMASANGFTLDFYGDGLIKLDVGDDVAATVRDVATGEPLDALVSNAGTLSADGGTVALTAAAARTVVDSVINNTGVIEANTVGLKNGRIVLGAATADTKPEGAPTQTVKVSGRLSASGTGVGENGGEIEITGEAIELAGATIDASGYAGGGRVVVGGEIGGGNPNLALVPAPRLRPDRPVPNATTVAMDAATTIDASGTQAGDGGTVVLWSDGTTVADGVVSVRGGVEGGDGGFVETSGRSLQAFGNVDVSGPWGAHGLWLLDPVNLAVVSTPGSGGSEVSAASIVGSMNAGGNVALTTVGTVGPDEGDITIAADLWKTAGGAAALNVSSANNIMISSGVSIGSSMGALDLGLFAGGGISASSITGFNLNGGTLTLDSREGIAFHAMGPMPNTIIRGEGGNESIYIHLGFEGGDRVEFTYDDQFVHVPTSGIVLANPKINPILLIDISSVQIFQPGPADGSDLTTTNIYAPYGRGVDPYMCACGWGDYYYGYLMFDLESLPPQVDSASIVLYNRADDLSAPVWHKTDVLVDRVTGAWSETGTTWFNQPGGVMIETIPQPSPEGQWITIDISDIYNQWGDGTYDNYGIRLRPVSNYATLNAFASSDNDIVEFRPKLVVRSAIDVQLADRAVVGQQGRDVSFAGVDHPIDIAPLVLLNDLYGHAQTTSSGWWVHAHSTPPYSPEVPSLIEEKSTDIADNTSVESEINSDIFIDKDAIINGRLTQGVGDPDDSHRKDAKYGDKRNILYYSHDYLSSFGREIRASSRGIVVSYYNDAVDPDVMSRNPIISARGPGYLGNYITIYFPDLDIFLTYAHLKQGSLAFEAATADSVDQLPNDNLTALGSVSAGFAFAQVGRTGAGDIPHVHVTAGETTYYPFGGTATIADGRINENDDMRTRAILNALGGD